MRPERNSVKQQEPCIGTWAKTLEEHRMNDNATPFKPSEYDQKIKITLPFYEDFYDQIVEVVNAYFGRKLTWLDIGCGTGKMAEVAFLKTPIAHFTFCDSSPQMIEIARRRFSDKNTTFITSSIQKLGIEQKFNVITAVQVFHYFSKEDRLSATEKCYNILEHDGLFMSFENFSPHSKEAEPLFLKRWGLYQLSQGKSRADCDEHLGRYGKQYFPISISEHLNVLRQSGFQTAEIFWLSNMQVGLLGMK